jgi:4'-phosphopantetheinyl transferase
VKAGPLLDSLSSEAHIWLTGPAEPGEASSYLPLLAPEEIAQFERFKVEGARRLYLAARALARSTLSLYYPAVGPAEWRFRFNDHGRPEIDPAGDWPPLRFNLSHTDGLVACLVTWELDAGVDVENIERRINLVGVARHSFSEIETAEVRRRRSRSRRRRFFYYWTLKESYIKARGMGLALPLRKFWFTFPETGVVDITFDNELGDREADWQFALYQASPSHMLAAGIRRGQLGDRRLVIRRSTPLAREAEEVTPRRLVASQVARIGHGASSGVSSGARESS